MVMNPGSPQSKMIRRGSINNIHCMYASQRSTGITHVVPEGYLGCVPYTMDNHLSRSQIPHLATQSWTYPQRHSIYWGSIFEKCPRRGVWGESQSSHQHWNIKWPVMERRSNWVDEVVVWKCDRSVRYIQVFCSPWWASSISMPRGRRIRIIPEQVIPFEIVR